jgi:hypothetical protein
MAPGEQHDREKPSGPYKNGVKRTFDLQDYKYVIEVAKAAGVLNRTVMLIDICLLY